MIRDVNDNRKKKVDEILSIVKISSLLFSAIAFLQYTFNLIKHNNNFLADYSILSILISIFLLSTIYMLWSLASLSKYKDYLNAIQWIEIILFMVIFVMAILVSGANSSNNKFLFLFIIITSTIQGGMHRGCIVSIVSSAIILVIDLIFAGNNGVNMYFQNDLILAGVFVLTAWTLGFYVKTENDHIKELQKLVNEDGLTGVYNHRYFYDKLREKMHISEVENKQLSLIFMDIDYFKHYNDLYGHQRGDEALKRIGSILKSVAREGDLVARYGGEEFAIILPNTSEIEATKIAETIRNKIEKTYFEGQENQPNSNLTVSVGIAVFPDKAENELDLVKYADDALYRAKFFHKNRVETYISVLDELKKDLNEEENALVTSIKTLIGVINAKDKYTYSHVERVVVYSRLMAKKLGLSEKEKKQLIYGAYMHDIGKINIPNEILTKKMRLTKDEWEILKQHPKDGVEIIKSVNSLKEVVPLILYHHERYDGFGYPEGLKGEDIPYLARVLTVVDSFDAMTSSRPYNKRKTYDEGLEELNRCSGTQFDSKIVEVFTEVVRENINEIQDF
ncbi:diguanylate cyclase [Clostridium sp. LIBA-8841]|uniref:diguanylate cyclase n=1 Tax=Clostridium sp. LIBA-8841 TaxID=2987530 RepID=UPI002AC65DE4|nr:diguanylate cyclase [Clostridium sp. LIBA-8841]MDZ5252473.1 diguanylate cyclase [Clostridium sp. LIBA-8841]